MFSRKLLEEGGLCRGGEPQHECCRPSAAAATSERSETGIAAGDVTALRWACWYPPGPGQGACKRHVQSPTHYRCGPTSMEAHVGRPAAHPGQFCDEIDEDTALLSVRLVDFVHGGIPVFTTNKQHPPNTHHSETRAERPRGVLGAATRSVSGSPCSQPHISAPHRRRAREGSGARPRSRGSFLRPSAWRWQKP